MPDPAKDPRLVAAVDLIGRAGGKSFQIRYDDEQDPIVWVAVAEWVGPQRLCGCGFVPAEAAMDLVMKAAQTCAHCGKPAGVTDDWRSDMPNADTVCWFVFDPETERFRRSCEGDTVGRAYGWNPTTGTAVGRNDPCPCGSGLKWKKCHGSAARG